MPEQNKGQTVVFPKRPKRPRGDMPSLEQQIHIDIEQLKHSHRAYRIAKRVQDVLLSAIALILLSPFMLLLALIIVIDSPGASPLFVQERVGKDGRSFRFVKFRSMVPNAEKKLEALLKQNEMDGPVFKIRHDPRITRVGRVIRKLSIDELPQLWNVLKGDMSIVGPRPALPREVRQYGEYERQRLYVTPGLTCLWQIQPSRNDMSFYEWLQLDLKYIQQRSFALDWSIIVRTIGAVIGMNGM